ncbi:ATP-binding protein [Streptomyces sp. NPDC002685]|uniref:ATP-binding protein n=2 Tax=unclassified Streptomyces TaxID=2593676 RepID=UPI00331EB579
MKRTYMQCVVPAAGPPVLRGQRRDLRRRMTEWGLEHACEDVLLVTGELIANALEHGRPPVRVVLTETRSDEGRRLRIEVTDAGTGPDVGRVRATWRHPSFSLADGGRGLLIVDTLAENWGDEPTAEGHTVWADVDCAAAGIHAGAAQPPRAASVPSRSSCPPRSSGCPSCG